MSRLGATWLAVGWALNAADPAPLLPTAETPAQREARLAWWRGARFGLFIHWGPSSLSGKEISWSRIGHPHDHPGHESVPAEEYDALYRRFNPTNFDADAWMQLARDAGMKYVVFTAKHHDGFSMWPTRLRPEYSIAATPFGRDICGELAAAAHRRGLKLGWYYSTRDWSHPDYLKDGNTKYNDFYHGQVRELLANYSRVDLVWFDHVAGQWRDYRFQELFEMLYRLQPGVLVNNRAAAFIRPTEDRPSPALAALVRGDFDTPEQRIGAFDNERPWESCVTLTQCADGGGWSYRPDGRTRTFAECLQMLVNCASGDGNLLLNVGPRPTGEIDPAQARVLRELGAWLTRHGRSVYDTRGGPFRNGAWGGSTYRGSVAYLHVFRWAGDGLDLPPIQARVVRAVALTGGTVRIEQSPAGLWVGLAGEDRDPTDTVVELELDAPAAQEFVKGKPLAVVDPLPLTLESPQDGQVFQRRSARYGRVRFSGRVPPGADNLEARLVGSSLVGTLSGAWQTLPFDVKGGTFDAAIETGAGGWYRCDMRATRRGKVLGHLTVPRVGVGEVFVVAGQSNAANHGSERQQSTSGRVSTLAGERWRPADDPQPGASGEGGSFIPAFGDALAARTGVPVGVACLAAGGTSVREWLPKGNPMRQQPSTGAHVRPAGPGQWEATGELFERLLARLTAFGPGGVRGVLWHQGESDAGQARAGYPADRQISGTQYREFMEQLIRAARAQAGWEVPWFTALTTYHSASDPADEEFRQAQRDLWVPGLALAGPDTDTLRAEFRDGVHFNGPGLRRHGEFWAECVGAWLEAAGLGGADPGARPAGATAPPLGAGLAARPKIEFWLTDPDGTARFQKQASPSAAGTGGAEPAMIEVDPGSTFQTIDGFGYTLTGGSAQLLMRMSQTARLALLRELFANDSTNIGVSYLRLSIGASDLNERVFSYDDLPAGQTDPELTRFSIEPDRAELIPVLRPILEINPALKIMGSPWSAPAWMKSNQDTRGGSLKPDCYPAYARYLVRYVEAMRAERIPIDAITVQNEPLHPGNNPSMFMPAAAQAEFIGRHLGPAFRVAGLTTRIVCYDHNADRPDYPLAILADPVAGPFVDGSAFHLYAGRIEALAAVHDAHPDKNLYFTEQWIGAPGNLKGDLAWHTTHLIVGAIRNWCRTVLEWNLASAPDYRPHTDRGGCDRCLGAVTIAGDTVVRNPGYYIIAHASKFVRPGSVRIGSTLLPALPNVAFRTPDGRLVLTVLNRESPARSFAVRCGTETFATSLPGGAVGTFVWSPPAR